MKYFVTHLFTVLVDADNSDHAARKFSAVPSMAELEKIGKVIRTNWQVEFDETTEEPKT